MSELTREQIEHRIEWIKQIIEAYAGLNPDTEVEIDAIYNMALRSLPAAGAKPQSDKHERIRALEAENAALRKDAER